MPSHTISKTNGVKPIASVKACGRITYLPSVEKESILSITLDGFNKRLKNIDTSFKEDERLVFFIIFDFYSINRLVGMET